LLFLLVRAFAKTDKVIDALGDHADRVAARHFEERYGEAEDSDQIVVVIPALNEQDNLPRVMSEIPPQLHDLPVEVIVVSDGSIDKTERVGEALGALIVGRDLQRGQGAAVALGYRVAVARGSRAVATLDADGQYDPKELPQLLEPILSGAADVVHGSRHLGAYDQPIIGRAQGIKVFAWLTSLITGTRITDPASGFRAFSTEALEQLEFRERQFHAGEVTVAAAKKGLRIAEVPCTFRERISGDSKKPPFMRYGYGYTRTLLRTWIR
jgi:glycosyltransferase involved in cell wall biosynthesis